MFFEQIEKFQCLKSSTAQGLSHGTLKSHVARVQKRVLKLVNFDDEKSPKPDMSDLETNTPSFYYAWGSLL